MIIHGITTSDLVAAYVERFHPNQNILVIYLNGTDSCKKVLEDLELDMEIPILTRIETGLDFIMIGSYREGLTKFINDHNHLIYDTRLELYIDSCLCKTN